MKRAACLACLVAVLASPVLAQTANPARYAKAQQAMQDGDFSAVEKSFAAILKPDPDDMLAQIGLGNALIREEKYVDAVALYQQALSADRKSSRLTQTQRRILIDQLAMAYGISGHTAQSKALLLQSVQNDPSYPLNYYNLACVAADENDKPSVLKYLNLAFQNRKQVLPGEQLPDPAADSSFQKYRTDADFQTMLQKVRQPQQ